MITTKIIDAVASLVMGEIRRLPSPLDEEELAHVLAVVRHADVLAVRRHLDRDLLQIAAWVHDRGRYGGEDRGHGKGGAILARDLLEELGMEEDLVDAVVSAVRHHTKKDRLHAELDEALKDADCLAQREAGTLNAQDPYRVLRSTRALSLEPPTAGDPEACRSYLQATLEGLLKDLEGDLNSDRVHDLRVACRRLRALLGATSVERKIIKPLKGLGRALGPAREASVNLAIARTHLGQDRLSSFQKAVRREERGAAKALGDLVLHKRRILNAIEGLRLVPTEDALEALDPRSILAEEAWHVRRVMIKRLRYAVESSLIRSTHPTAVIETLKELQDLYGEWHDLKRFLATADLKQKEVRKIKTAIERMEKTILQRTASDMFWIRYHL